MPRDLIRQICQAREVVIIREPVSPDHIYMLVSAPANMAPHQLMQYIKGAFEATNSEPADALLRPASVGTRILCATVEEDTIKA